MDPAAEKRKERNACTAMCCPNASTAAVHVPSLSPGPLPCLRGVYVTVTCGRYTRRYCRRIPGVGGRIPGVETERERSLVAASSQSWNQAGEVAKSSLLRTKLSRRSSPLPPQPFLPTGDPSAGFPCGTCSLLLTNWWFAKRRCDVAFPRCASPDGTCWPRWP